MKEINKPKLRFKEFNNEWKVDKIKQLGTLKAGGDVNKNTISESGNYPVIANGLSNSGIIGYYENDYKVDYPSVTITGRGINFGVSVPRNYKYTPVVRLLVFKSDLDIYFSALVFNMIHFFNESTGVPQLTTNQLGSYSICYPEKEEQKQIGRFFNKIDNLIELKGNKIATLERLKHGYLQNLFTDSYEGIPKLRFNGFNDNWSIKHLKDIANIVGGGTPKTDVKEYWGGSINWFSPNELNGSPYVNNSVKKITELGLKKSSAKLHPANNTLLFTSRAGIGKMAILKQPATTNQGFQSLELKNGYHPYFIYSYNNELKRKAIRLSSGSTFDEISKPSMESIKLSIPTFKEQIKIGTAMKLIDEQINLQHKELEHLQKLKKGYLQKMFV